MAHWTRPPFEVGELLASGEYSDMVLVCQGVEFKVHKMIVLSQSPVLKVAMQGNYKEAETFRFTITDFDVPTVRRMLQYLYTSDYDDGYTPCRARSESTSPLPPPAASSKRRNVISRVTMMTEMQEDTEQETEEDRLESHPETDRAAVSVHIKVNAIADFLDIKGLMHLSSAKIMSLSTHLEAKDFLSVTHEALEVTGDRQLHSLMAEMMADEIHDMLDADGLQDSMGHFGVDVLRQIVRRTDKTEEELQLAVAQLELDLSREMTKRRAAEARGARIIANMDKCLATLRERWTCRNTSCDADFECLIEQRGQPNEPVYVVRCARCLCKH